MPGWTGGTGVQPGVFRYGRPREKVSSLFGQPAERVARQAVDLPLVHRHGAELSVEADGRLVPVEHGPLEAGAVALARQTREVREQPAAHAAPAHLRPDVEVFEVEAAQSRPRREVVEEERHPGRLAADVGDAPLGDTARAEQRLAQTLLVGDHLVGRTL